MQEYLANQKVLLPIAWTANRSSGAIAMTQFSDIGFQITWTSLTGTLDGSITFSVSNDGTNWDALSTTVAITSANGNECVAIEDVFFTFIKVDAVKNSIASGTIEVSATFK